ncbi:hypothetical protein R1sor_003543 [Riccia sorocarpa]|uniref:EF-hand domain-containing protein n=1 Tax=Riccia sorocarpa TaxID=122646 RepID=A0ABD3H3K6_9MARC
MNIGSLKFAGVGSLVRPYAPATELSGSAEVGCSSQTAAEFRSGAFTSSKQKRSNGGRKLSTDGSKWTVEWPKGGKLARCNAGNGEADGEETDAVVHGMRKLLVSEELAVAEQAAIDLVSTLEQQGRAVLLSALYRSSMVGDPGVHFKEADTNLDGFIDEIEFTTYAEAQAVRYGASTKPLTTEQMFYLFRKSAVGMVGFGFTDNAIMLIAGDVIQNSIGATLGLTTLLSAGLGNAVADLIGTAFRGYIERLTGKLMVQNVPISVHQMQQKEAWWAETTGASFGVTVGCLLGLTPLFLIQRKKGQEHHDGGGVDTKFASITVSSLLTADEVECSEASARITTLRASVQSPSHLGNFQAKLWGTPLLLLSVVVMMAVRRVVNYRKASGFHRR